MALRRWKPFLGAFDHVDAAIESASAARGGRLSREEFQRARARIVEALCGAADYAAAEGICRLLDDAMAESLVTLRAAHAEKNPELLASSELVAAVGALARGHGSGRVCGLARGWRAAVEEELATARAAMDVLDRVSAPTMPRPKDNASPDLDAATTKKESAVPGKQQPRPRTTQARLPLVAGSCRVDTAKISEPSPKKTPPLAARGNCFKTSLNVQASAKVPAPQHTKKTSPPVACSNAGDDRVAALCSAAEDKKKMEATKRKFHERYQEAEEAKRRRTIQVVMAPEMLRQKGLRATHPAVKARGPACSAAESRRCFSMSSVLRV